MSRTPNSVRRLRSAGPLRGEHVVPGDKSISHRVAMLAAFARGTSTIENFATSEDCWSTVRCLRALGARIESDERRLVVAGGGREALSSPTEPLDAGNSGTTIRLLSGLLAGTPVDVTITGDESLRTRPMERVARPLRRMGAEVLTTDGRPPISIRGRQRLQAVEFEPETPSAQVKSAILLAGLSAPGRTRVLERVRTRNHTERLLAAYGAACGEDERGVWVDGPAEISATDVVVPGDFSSAAFLFALALMLPGSDVVVRGVGLNPTRTRMLDILADLGATIEVGDVRGTDSEPLGDVRVRYRDPLATRDGSPLLLDGPVVAEIIDEVPILAVLATQVRGGVRFTGAADLRKKESDRIAALAENLQRMGATAEERPDGLSVPGPQRLRGAVVDSRGDHRIAMAFACAAMIADGETTVRDADAVGVSFPEFFDHLPDGGAVEPEPEG